MKTVKYLLAMIKVVSLICLLLLAGCATIINGPTQEISITSNPPGATITANDSHNEYQVIKTPGKLRLKRSKPAVLVAQLTGYQTIEKELKSNYSLFWMAGDISLGYWAFPPSGVGIPCGAAILLVDTLSGSCFDLETNKVHFELISNK